MANTPTLTGEALAAVSELATVVVTPAEPATPKAREKANVADSPMVRDYPSGLARKKSYHVIGVASNVIYCRMYNGTL